MKRVVIAVHGGAGSLTGELRKNLAASEEGIQEALHTGHQVLKRGKSAIAAVEAAVMKLEDNPFFNAGRGSALNKNGEVEMDASIMDGKTLKAGAVSMVRSVKNPIMLARKIITKTSHVFLSGYGALDLAKYHNIVLEPDDYFITPHQLEVFQKRAKRVKKPNFFTKMHGTVGAVALDCHGHLAAATSTGGTGYSLPGRIGDSCIIGAGCYANRVCAISGTGEGEFLITRVVAHTIAMLVEYKNFSLQKACDFVVHKRDCQPKKEVGVIAVGKNGNIAMSFNTRSMRRGYIDSKGNLKVEIY